MGGQRQADRHLAIVLLAVPGLDPGIAAILALHAYGVRALLDQGGVIDDQHGLGPAQQPVGLVDQFLFERCCLPR